MSNVRALLPLCLALVLGACAGEPAKSDDGKADDGKADGAKDTGEPPVESTSAEPAADTGPMPSETGDPEPETGETGDAAGETGDAAGETGEAAEGETGEAPETESADDGGDGGDDGGDKKGGDKKGGDKKGGSKADLELGKTMYLKKCKNCHAADGHGSEKFAKKVDNLPSLKKTKLSKSKVKKIIEAGVPDTKMKGYKGKLSAEEIDAVTAFVMTL